MEQSTATNDPKAYTSFARATTRDQLAEDVERFLQQGGGIKEVPKDFRADPPRKPESNYGRGSI